MSENLETGFATFRRDPSVPDAPTEGIRPSIIPSIFKDIGRAISYLRGKANMTTVLDQPHVDFARKLADRFAAMEDGAVVMSGVRKALEGDDARQRIAI